MTLNLYTHTPADYTNRILAVLDGPAAYPLPASDEPNAVGDPDEATYGP
ncbi:MAG TPA: hypothetical protein VGJ53_12420 [Micromonosporaceae bacterium]